MAPGGPDATRGALSVARDPDLDDLDPVEASDLDDELEEEPDGLAPVVFEDDDEDEAFEDDEDDDDTEVVVEVDEDDEDAEVDLPLPPFDEETLTVVPDDDEDDDPDGLDDLREGEFVCRSCYMAKRESALADPDRMLCRDCA